MSPLASGVIGVSGEDLREVLLRPADRGVRRRATAAPGCLLLRLLAALARLLAALALGVALDRREAHGRRHAIDLAAQPDVDRDAAAPSGRDRRGPGRLGLSLGGVLRVERGGGALGRLLVGLADALVVGLGGLRSLVADDVAPDDDRDVPADEVADDAGDQRAVGRRRTRARRPSGRGRARCTKPISPQRARVRLTAATAAGCVLRRTWVSTTSTSPFLAFLDFLAFFSVVSSLTAHAPIAAPRARARG